MSDAPLGRGGQVIGTGRHAAGARSTCGLTPDLRPPHRPGVDRAAAGFRDVSRSTDCEPRPGGLGSSDGTRSFPLMQLRVLGPVEASADHRSLPLGGAKQRSVLAMLGLDANRTVSRRPADRGPVGRAPAAERGQDGPELRVAAAQACWPSDAGAEIVTRGRGYELRIEPDAVDVARFERLLSRRAAPAQRPEPADAAREALALWRGPALADVADEPFAAAEIRRLEELRLAAAELAIDADLAAGRHSEVVGGDRGAGRRAPAARAPPRASGCSRSTGAGARRRRSRPIATRGGCWSSEIGVEPGPELRRLHEAILRHDPALEVEAATLELPRELDAAAAPPLVGRDERAGVAARALASGRGAARGRAHRAGRRARASARRRLAAELAGDRPRRRRDRAVRGGRRSARAGARRVARARAAAERRCSSSTTPIAPAPRCGPRCGRCGARLATAPALVARHRCGRGGARAASGPTRRSRWSRSTPRPCAQIAALYAPAAGATGEPGRRAAGRRAAASPRRVHEVAGEWARREAARRVEPSPDRAAAGRVAGAGAGERSWPAASRPCSPRASAPSGSRRRTASEPGRVPVQGARDATTSPTPSTSSGASGSSPSSSRGSSARRCSRSSGPSGSGKSSVLRAGLLPALAAGVLPGKRRLDAGADPAGRAPARELRAPRPALGCGSARRDRRRSVRGDVHGLPRRAGARRVRRRARSSAHRTRDGTRWSCSALRADFYGRCAAYPELARLVGANNVIVGPMSRDELRRAIELPGRTRRDCASTPSWRTR